jgi:hypothetical protein
MPETKTIPDGYRTDARGRLVPKELIKPVDLLRDELVTELFTGALDLHDRMVTFKAKVFASVGTFAQMSAEEYGTAIGGRKGNISLYSFDGRFKIQVATADHIQFDERLQAAKALIDECIGEWSKGSSAEIRVLVQDAFRVDLEGNLNTGRILGLRRLEITDARWQRAMKAIGESVQVIGTKSYVRVYQRVGETDQYEAVTLDIAKA